VAHVFCDGVDVNWRQVSDGYAWCFPKYLKHPDECLSRERDARAAKRGFWGEPAFAPWDWRAKRGTP
jgi:endonuclease YncB( thermonuclease family)